jgi:amino acid transporter
MTVRGAALLGVGAMVGAGIFALLGEAGAVAGAATWISFLIAGIVSLLIGYNVVKLGVRYPSSGGLFQYLLEGFGNGRLLGIAAWLGYMSAVLIVCSMCAVSFGDYAVSLFVSEGGADWWDNVFASVVVIAMALVVIVGPDLVAKAQTLIVVIMVGILGVFVVVTLPSIDLDLLAFGDYPPVSDIVASVALTFFAFLGFSVITFAVGDMRDPARDLPKAMNRALVVTTLVYVLVAVSVFGTLTVDEVVRYGPTAIAEAGRPALGDAGFTMIAIAAMVGMAGSVVATLYASAGLTRMLAGVGQFPPFFGPRSRLGAKSGVLISAAVVLVVSNTVDLSAIASVGSACSLMIFVLVGVAGYRLRGKTGAQAWLILAGVVVTLVVLGFFVVDTMRNAPETFAAIVLIGALAIVLDVVWKRVRGEPPASAPLTRAAQE